VTKSEIIEAAFKVWGRNFYRKTSLTQLAKELKVSKPALYRHFTNKQALFAAMTERFFDDFTAFVRTDFENAQKTADADEGIFTIIRSITRFFAQDVYALVFSLINIYDRILDSCSMAESIKERGVDLLILQCVIEKKYSSNMAVLKLLFNTLTFNMSLFHKANESFIKSPSAAQIQNIISRICGVIANGLGFSSGKAGKLDFDKLEAIVEKSMQKAEPEPLFKAVAEAVAEAGPWEASMEMVAKRMGFSKSSLYGHFKDRKDMMRRLFKTEFTRIIEFARQGISLSSDSAEQLYLGIYSIAVYLRSRPETIAAMGWIRTRKLDLGKPEKNIEMFRLFEDVEIDAMQNAGEEEKQKTSHWILFLLISVLMQPNDIVPGKASLQHSQRSFQTNNDIRDLYKFITMGLGGFLR